MSESGKFYSAMHMYWGLYVLGTFVAYLLGYFGTQEASLYIVFAVAMLVFIDG